MTTSSPATSSPSRLQGRSSPSDWVLDGRAGTHTQTSRPSRPRLLETERRRWQYNPDAIGEFFGLDPGELRYNWRRDLYQCRIRTGRDDCGDERRRNRFASGRMV